MANYIFSYLDQVFDFGKYSGFTLEEILDSNPSYIAWCIDNIPEFCMKPNLIEVVRNRYADINISEEFENRFYTPQDDETDDYYGAEDCGFDDYESHYDEFAGTYAQDVMGYSDEEIYDIFDGEPDAYWNID